MTFRVSERQPAYVGQRYTHKYRGHRKFGGIKPDNIEVADALITIEILRDLGATWEEIESATGMGDAHGFWQRHSGE